MQSDVGYKFLTHTTDAYIEAVGFTLEESFGYAATAMFDTMCNIATVSNSLVERIHVEGSDEVSLLYDWLEALLLKFEIEGRVFSVFQARIFRRGSLLVLDADAIGEMYDKKKHGSKVEVKAVTFHRMEILRRSPLTIVRFILDL